MINPAGPVMFSGSSDRIAELAAAFAARHRLVITGGPGTGKTTLAVQPLLELLPLPGEPPAGPVPVLFSLFSWDLAVQPRVQDWLTDQLMQTYPALQAISEDAAAALVEQSRVLPVLDGLDELLPARAAAIINSLNASLPGGVILTSRRAEYLVAIATARDRLTAADDIEPLPLTTAEAAAYLRHHLQPNPEPAWDALLENLTPAAGPAPSATPALAQIVATPLGLWLVRAVYMDSHRDPAPLIAPSATPDSLREDLFAQLISALIAARPPNR